MSEVNQLNIVYWEVLNTALYHTKVPLGFSSKHTQVDIPFIIPLIIIDEGGKVAWAVDFEVLALLIVMYFGLKLIGV